jgi:hypothetical protein
MNRPSGQPGVARPLAQRRRFLALAGAGITLALVGCGSASKAGSESPRFVGYEWQVVAISRAGKVTSIPARLNVALRFSADGQFGANDGVNFHSGTYRATSDGFTTSSLSTTLIGYAGHDPAVLLAISAIGTFGDGTHAKAELIADHLVVRVGSYTLSCERHSLGPSGPSSAPAGSTQSTP